MQSQVYMTDWRSSQVVLSLHALDQQAAEQVA